MAERMAGRHGLRFDVNCSILFTELPLLKRPAAAAAAGSTRLGSGGRSAARCPAIASADAFLGALGDAGVSLARLAATGYPGRVGLEYKPADPADSRASFGWLTAADGREKKRRLTAQGLRPTAA